MWDIPVDFVDVTVLFDRPTRKWKPVRNRGVHRQADRLVAAPIGRPHRTAGEELTSSLAICVWIPLFALRVEEARHPEYAHRPVALLAPNDARRLWQVSPAARRIGVKPGVTVSQAIAVCPALTLCQPDPVFYDEQFSRLLLRLGDVSPIIEPVELGHAFVGVDGLERLYGPPNGQLHAAKQAVMSACPWVGSLVRLGWGRGKFTAWVAATRAQPGHRVVVADEQRDGFLSSQPIAVLPLTPDDHRRLSQLGLRTLGELTTLPQEAVVSQFGRQGRLAWQLAAGMVDEPVRGHHQPPPIVTAVDFPAPIADYGMLAHAVERLVERGLRHPRRTGWRVHSVRVLGELEQGPSWSIDVTLKEPSGHKDRITAPIKTRLDQAPPTGAVERLAVVFTILTPGTDELQLFARDAASFARAGRRTALRKAAQEIKTRLRRPLLCHVIEVSPHSRLPERRYALIDFEL